MKTNAQTPINEAPPKRNVPSSSIRDTLDFGRLTLSSVVRRSCRICLLSIACAASVITARAQYIWDGGGTTSNWSDHNNWNGGSSPTGGAQIHFAGNIDLTPNNDLNIINGSLPNNLFSSVTFDANAGAFTISGNPIALSSGYTNNSSNNQTINVVTLVHGSQTWTAATADLTFNAAPDLLGNALTVAGSHNFIFNDGISDSSGGGSLVMNGTGVAMLNTGSSYTGNTTVNSGVLIVNGSIASARTTINSGGALAGNGTIGGNLTNNGLLLPGIGAGPFDPTNPNYVNPVLLAAQVSAGAFNLTSTGSGAGRLSNVLTVNGSYTQSATGALVIVYGGPAASQHTSLNVQGQANLNGALVILPVNGARLTPGQEVPIVTAAGGVTGKFSLTDAPLLNATVVYEPTSVVLEASQGSVASTLSGISGISGNFLSVGRGLDSAANDPRAAKIFSVLNSDSLPQLIKDVGHIDPDKLTSMSTVGGATSGVHLQNLQLRMQALQSGATGFSAMGFHVADNSSSSTTTDTTAIGYAGPTGPEGKGGKEVAPPPADNRWGTFITGAGEFDHVGDTQSARGFNLDSGGITLGIDYRFTDHFVAGVFAGYTYTGIDIADGRIAVDTGKFGLYGTYFDGGFYINSAVQGGYDGYVTNRTSLGGNAHSSPTGGDFNLLFAPGYNWTVGGLTFGPTTRFQYSYESVNGFTESGSLAPLKVDSQHSESIVSAVGMKASYDWKVGTTIIRPELRLEWEHEYGDVSTTIASQLASGAGSSFNVTGPQIGRDDLHLGAGVAVVFSDRLTAYAYYDGQYFRTNYDSSTVTGGFRFLF